MSILFLDASQGISLQTLVNRLNCLFEILTWLLLHIGYSCKSYIDNKPSMVYIPQVYFFNVGLHANRSRIEFLRWMSKTSHIVLPAMFNWYQQLVSFEEDKCSLCCKLWSTSKLFLYCLWSTVYKCFWWINIGVKTPFFSNATEKTNGRNSTY